MMTTYGDAWLDGYFKRRAKLDAAINKYPDFSFPASLGLRMHRMDVEWWSHKIKDPAKRRAFQDAAHQLIAGKTFAKGMGVPRGVDVEHLYYTVGQGWSDAQYADFLNRMD